MTATVRKSTTVLVFGKRFKSSLNLSPHLGRQLKLFLRHSLICHAAFRRLFWKDNAYNYGYALLDTDLHWMAEFRSMLTKFLMWVKVSLSRSEGRYQWAYSAVLWVHTGPHFPDQQRMWITNQQLQLATGCLSFACPHASFISIILPQCETLHLSCKC